MHNQIKGYNKVEASIKSKENFSGELSINIWTLKFIDRDSLSMSKLYRQLRYINLTEICRNKISAT